jgi:hypothetical protein
MRMLSVSHGAQKFRSMVSGPIASLIASIDFCTAARNAALSRTAVGNLNWTGHFGIICATK